MRRTLLALSTAAALAALPGLAYADGHGAITGAAGGAVAGAVVGGPVGAAVGGVAGAAIGGASTGPDHTTVVHEEAPVAVEPCSQTTVQRSDDMGNSSTTTRTNCP